MSFYWQFLGQNPPIFPLKKKIFVLQPGVKLPGRMINVLFHQCAWILIPSLYSCCFVCVYVVVTDFFLLDLLLVMNRASACLQMSKAASRVASRSRNSFLVLSIRAWFAFSIDRVSPAMRTLWWVRPRSALATNQHPAWYGAWYQ